MNAKLNLIIACLWILLGFVSGFFLGLNLRRKGWRGDYAISLSACIALMFLTCGCVGIVPVPTLSNKPVRGRAIETRDSNFIVCGKTTREEIVQRLGTNFREDWQKRAMAYSWELPGGRAFGWWFTVSSFGSVGDKGEFEWSRWHALFVAFDEHGIAIRKSFVRLSGGKSLDEQMDNWAKRVFRSIKIEPKENWEAIAMKTSGS